MEILSLLKSYLSLSLQLGQGRRRIKSIFVILTIRDNNGKHPKPNLLSPTLQGLARHLSTVATAYINLKIFLSDSIHMLYFD